MRETTFRKPTVKEIFEMQGIECPQRITSKFILELISKEIIVTAGNSYEEAVETIDELDFEDKSIVLFGEKFRVPGEESNRGIKSLDSLLKIDSRQNLRIAGYLGAFYDVPAPRRLTKGFVNRSKVEPSHLIGISLDQRDIENPPSGFYWVGTEGVVRATTWMRAIAGAEMQVMRQAGDFSGEVVDSKPYGRNLRVRVSSRTEEGGDYEFTLSRLPFFKETDPERFAGWVNISHNSSDPDASYKGLEHNQRAHPVSFWSASTIFSFYEAMRFLRKHPGERRFITNPFPIPTNQKMIDFVDSLRLKSIIVNEEDGRLRCEVLNKGEMDLAIGARTLMRGYGDCWHHGRKPLDYLYQPGS